MSSRRHLGQLLEGYQLEGYEDLAGDVLRLADPYWHPGWRSREVLVDVHAWHVTVADELVSADGLPDLLLVVDADEHLHGRR